MDPKGDPPPPPPLPAANTDQTQQQQQQQQPNSPIAQQPTNFPNQYQQRYPMNPGQGQFQQGPPGMQQQYYQNPMMMGPPGGGYGYAQGYVQQQPIILGPPPPIRGVPTGLEALVPLNHVFIKQQVELLEVVANIETANRYDVLAGNGQRIYFAQETTGCCALCCCGPTRPFTIDIVDFFGRTVLQLERPYDYCLYLSQILFCLGKIGGSMNVNLGDGSKLGEIVHVFNCCKPKYEIRDAAGRIIMWINGPGCGDCCGAAPCGTAEFPITSSTGQEIGAIRKTWAGFFQEFATDADNFGVDFPPDLDIRWKALIFAAVFLIDFMYFENGQQQNQHHHHHHGYY